MPVRKEVFVEVAVIPDLLTAEKARKIATNWQDNHISEYVNRALDAVQARAQAGFFDAYVSDPSPSQINQDECIRAMKSLGYTIKTTTTHGIWWAW